MSLNDDDDNPFVTPVPNGVQGEAGDGAPTTEEALEEEAQDFRLFASAFTKKGISAQTIRKGEKDFESHGTRAQESQLEQSRQAMQDVLSFTRSHKPSQWVRGWYFPDHWADAPDDEPFEQPADASSETASGKTPGQKEQKRGAHARDRVVVVENIHHTMFSVLGRTIAGQAKDRPAREKTWLLPEEALFLVERGSLDLWWPTRGIEEVFPPKSEDQDDSPGEDGEAPLTRTEEDEYELGTPLSLQAAYALLIGNDGERGKISLEKYQVFAHLRRTGYAVLRAQRLLLKPHKELVPQHRMSIWQWIMSLVSSPSLEEEDQLQRSGPLVRPGLYRSYDAIYRQLALLPLHKPTPGQNTQIGASSPPHTEPPFEIFYHAWKAHPTPFVKTRPPIPDFYIAVADTQESYVPTLEQIAALLETTPWAPPKPEWQSKPGHLYPRLKHGYRSVLIAVVDHGLVNYMRFAEGGFGMETLWHRFDSKTAPRGGKRSGHPGRGRGGRGRGRGGRGRGGR